MVHASRGRQLVATALSLSVAALSFSMAALSLSVAALSVALAAAAQAPAPATSTAAGDSYPKQVVDSYPHYVPAEQVAGTIRVSGHGSAKIPWMRALLEAWEKDFQRFQPGVHLEYRMFGTSSAIPALWAGTADIAILGEEVDPLAVRTFTRVLHHPPAAFDILTGSVDIRNIDYAQMFFVHRSNPLDRITLAQLDAIYGTEHRRGLPANIRTWGQLGLTGDWAARPIHPYGWRIDDSFGIFLEQYLLGQSHRWNASLSERSHIERADHTIYDHGQQILDSLAQDPDGLAVANIRYAGPDVKPLLLARTASAPYLPVDTHTLIDQTYPLDRLIPAVIASAPGEPVAPLLREFLRYLLSREGQQIALDDRRYLPLSPAAASRERAQLR